jgi:hypothetical protein
MVQVGDYVMIWIDSFGTNTTQGGYETLCVEESCLRKLKEICPWVEEIDFMSDAGSGYKSSQTLLGLRNIKEVTGIRVRYVHFYASGEGKRWETDGHNTDIKVRREHAMRAGKPFACNTPASEVEAQLFNGGIEGSYPTLLEFDYKDQVEVDTWEGISGYHDFELHENGDITAWRSYQVGKGKRFAKADLDAKYKHGSTQPSTGAIFVADVGKSNEDFQPKVEKSSRRKRQLKVDKAEQTVARKKAKMDVSKAAKHKLHHAVAERVPFVCQSCERRFATEYQMAGHTCQLPSSGDTTAENIATETTTLFVSPITVPVSPNPAGSQQRWLLMGHGLAQFRFVTVLDDVVKEILEEQFQKGVEKSSNRKGVLEMVEECGKTVPELMAPSVHDVNSWLSSRLAREKKDQNSSTSAGPTRTKKRNKTQREKRQEEAAVIKMDQRPQIGDSTKQHLFLAKYLDILLIKDDVTRIVTGVNFTVDRACWTLTAATALQDKYDDRIYFADPNKLDTITIDVSSKRSGSSTCIQEFNKS